MDSEQARMAMAKDPTYLMVEIKANHVWHLAWLISERFNDTAPIGWGRYIGEAAGIIGEFGPSKDPKTMVEFAAGITR